jgi:predicted TIM-barrel fold metal-dependent hydrolase
MNNERPISRRDALKQAACAAAVTAIGSKAAKAADRPTPKYFDMHVHIGTYKAEVEPITAEQMLRWMDSKGVEKACVLPLVSPESFQAPVSTEQVLAGTERFRDRLVPFCCIDPRNSWISTRKQIVKQLTAYKALGAKGFGEHKVAVPINDPRNLELYASCGECELPILFHMDNIRNTDVPGLPGLEQVLQKFSKVTFIGHGPGIWASISGDATQRDIGGYPRGTVQPGGALDRLMQAYPNFYCDLSAGSGSSALKRDMTFAREFLLRRQNQIVFGTDYLAPGQEVEQFEIIEQLNLPDDALQKIARGNLHALLRMT